MSNIGERIGKLDAASVADAQKGFGILDPAITTRTPGLKLSGIARTVKCYPGSIITVHKALSEAQEGDVLVIDGEADVRAGALIGELMAREARDRGVAGVVVDGAVRDVAGLNTLGFPTFSRAVTPRVGVNRRLGETSVPVSVGGVIVYPGDYIVADDDGVAVIPSGQAEAIADAGEAIDAKEVGYAESIDRHERLADILGFREQFKG